MADFAIVEIAGKQYKAVVGQKLIVDKLRQQENEEVTFDKVLLLAVENAFKVGTPYVAGASVTGKVLAQEKGEKVYVVKFKAKSRYRRRTGFRAQLTRVAIEKIAIGDASKTSKTVKRSTK